MTLAGGTQFVDKNSKGIAKTNGGEVNDRYHD
jgi:hypothetical protein